MKGELKLKLCWLKLTYQIYIHDLLFEARFAGKANAHLKADIRQHLLAMQATDFLYAGMNRYFTTSLKAT